MKTLTHPHRSPTKDRSISFSTTDRDISGQQQRDEKILAGLFDRLLPIIDQGEELAKKISDELLPEPTLAGLRTQAVQAKTRKEQDERLGKIERLEDLKSLFVRRWDLLEELKDAIKTIGLTEPEQTEQTKASKGMLLDLFNERTSLDRQILKVVQRHFKQAVRPALIKEFGGQVARENIDAGSIRYTEMVNRFFIKVLEQRRDEFWRARSARELRGWASKVMTNEMRDRLRRRKMGQEINDDLMHLTESRQRHLEKYHKIELDDLIDLSNQWEHTGTADEKLMAEVLRHHYIDGMKDEEIAQQLDLDADRVKALKVAALQAIR